MKTILRPAISFDDSVGWDSELGGIVDGIADKMERLVVQRGSCGSLENLKNTLLSLVSCPQLVTLETVDKPQNTIVV